MQERKNKNLRGQILVLAPSEGIVPADTWLRCRKKLLANITFQGGHKARNTWLAVIGQNGRGLWQPVRDIGQTEQSGMEAG